MNLSLVDTVNWDTLKQKDKKKRLIDLLERLEFALVYPLGSAHFERNLVELRDQGERCRMYMERNILVERLRRSKKMSGKVEIEEAARRIVCLRPSQIKGAVRNHLETFRKERRL